MKIGFALTFVALAEIFFASNAQADSFDDPVCDSVCNTLINPSTNQITTITGDQNWSAADSAWCSANPFSLSSPPTTQAAANNDNVCQYHNSQVLTYCIAYDKIHKAQTMELPLLLLDVTGAGLCGVVCANEFDLIDANSPALYAACRLESTAASAVDLIDALTLSSDPTAQAVDGLLAAAGLGANILELQEMGLKGFTGGSQGANEKRNACITAAALSVASGLRTYDITHQQLSKQAACSDLKGLLSTSPVVGVASPTPSAPITVAAGGATIGTVNNLGPSAIIGSGSNLASQLSCAQGGLTSCGFANQGIMSAATDGGLLSSSGLDQVAAQQLAQSNLSGVSPTSPNTSGMLASALGNTSTDVAQKLLAVEKAAENNAKHLEGSTAFAKGAAVGESEVHSVGAFNFEAATTVANKKELEFKRAPATTGDGDIWHAGYSGSIFQIVSSKIVESKERVQPMDWTSPLNRALMGLPKLKGAQ
jgi:hypothetical protein